MFIYLVQKINLYDKYNNYYIYVIYLYNFIHSIICVIFPCNYFCNFTDEIIYIIFWFNYLCNLIILYHIILLKDRKKCFPTYYNTEKNMEPFWPKRFRVIIWEYLCQIGSILRVNLIQIFFNYSELRVEF